MTDTAGRGPIGGAAGEAGSAHRAAVAAQLVVAGLISNAVPEFLPSGTPASELGTRGQVPALVAMESDAPTDDIYVRLGDGASLQIQAKLSGSLPILKGVLRDQWIPSLIGGEDKTVFLALAVEEPTNELRTLGNAWRRRQDAEAGNPSGPEATALRDWDAIVEEALNAVPADLKDSVRIRLRNNCTVTILAGRMPEDPFHQVQLARLELVAPGRAADALEFIRAGIRTDAQLRTGATVQTWVRELRDHGFDLVEDEHGFAASAYAARLTAEVEYRARLSSMLNQLDVSFLGDSASDVEVPGLASGIRSSYQIGGDSRPHETSFLDSVRGSDRTWVLGEGGSGKSEAMRQLAAFAADVERARQTDDSLHDVWPDVVGPAPLPILVRLRDLLPANSSTPISISHGLIASIAAADMAPEHPSALTAVLKDALSRGNAVLMLDGLDECHARRGSMTAALARYIEAIPAHSVVLISGRPPTSNDAQRLGFSILTLAAPESFVDSTTLVLEHLGAIQAIDPMRPWLDARRAWLSSQTAGRDDLFSNPLMTLLAIGVAASPEETETLPRSRAALVRRVIDLFMERWESQRRAAGDLAISGLDAAAAVLALTESFETIAHELSGVAQIPEAHARERISSLLQGDFDLAPAIASLAASQILSAWGSSGFLRLDHTNVSPRLKILIEAGEAMHAVSHHDAFVQWTVDRIDQPDLETELLLAAELNPDALAILVGRIDADDGSDLVRLTDRITLAGKAIRAVRHASPTHYVLSEPDPAEAICLRLRAAVANLANDIDRERLERMADESSPLDRWAVWRAIEQLVDLTRTEDLDDVERLVMPCLTGASRTLIRALIRKRMVFDDSIQHQPSLQHVDDARGALLDGAEDLWVDLIDNPHTEAAPDPRGSDDLRSLFAKQRFQWVTTLAAQILLPSRPDLAPSIAGFFSWMGSGQAHLVADLLDREGHGALLEVERSAQVGHLARTADMILRSSTDSDAWLRSLAEGSQGVPALSNIERWRLSSLGQLVELYRINWLKSGELRYVSDVAAQELSVLDSVAIRLLGLERDAVAAQASQLLDSDLREERPFRLAVSLLNSSREYKVDWERSLDIVADRDALMSVVTTGHQMLVTPVCLLLSECPEKSSTARALADALDTVVGWAQYHVALTACELDPETMPLELSSHESGAVRASAALYLSYAAASLGLGSVLEALRSDEDTTVRNFSHAPNEGTTFTDADSALRATCLHCGFVSGVQSSCEGCGLVIPRRSR